MSTSTSWKKRARRLLAGLVTFVVAIGAAGWFLFRYQTPVTTEQAVELFRTGNDETTSDSYEVGAQRRPISRKVRDGAAGGAISRDPDRPSTSGRAQSAGNTSVATTRSPHFDVMPAEGVYLYKGSGWEGVGYYKRPFDPNTERIITHHDRDTWTEHHIFSEQRASWTKITTSETGRIVHGQRNDIKIGPNDVIDETRDISFNPPLQATVFPPPPVGEVWGGRFTGRTQKGERYTGTYTVRVIEDDVWTIGGTRTRILGYDMDVEFEGDVEGTVEVKYWFSPIYGITVREEYDADARVGPFDYHAEWFVKLRSLTPRT